MGQGIRQAGGQATAPSLGHGAAHGARVLRGAIGFVLVVAGYWALESAVHAFVLHRGTFLEDLAPHSPNELWMRAVTVVLLVVIGVLLSRRTAVGFSRETAVLARIVEAADEGILITDRHGRIEHVNPAFTRITGYPLAEVVGKTPAILNSGVKGDAFYQGLWQTIENGHVWVGTLTDRRRDGTYYPVVLTIAPVMDDHGRVTHFVGIQRDERERAALTARLDQAEKLASLGQVVGGVAHDFNNALTTMTALSDLAARKAKGNAELAQILSGIDVAVDGAGALVRQLLAFVRESAPDAPVGHLDLAGFVARVEPALEALVSGAVALEIAGPPAGTTVRADAHGLQHVLTNLLLNAADAVAGRPGARISVSFETGSDGTVAMRVRDNGPGIPGDRREAIFAPYYTTKGEGRGTGLGLPSARETARRFGGDLVLEDAGGEGTTFLVRLLGGRGA